MTPQEKSKELYHKFFKEIPGISVLNDRFIAKKCSLIAVDELNKFLIDSESEDFNLPDEFSIQYWQEVKQEIEKL